jgi:hypothetical protein
MVEWRRLMQREYGRECERHSLEAGELETREGAAREWSRSWAHAQELRTAAMRISQPRRKNDALQADPACLIQRAIKTMRAASAALVGP